MPKSPSAKAQKAAAAQGTPGAPKAKGAKCDETQDEHGHCQTCVRLRLECLGFGAKRPEWLREQKNVVELREKIKTFLASQGMIKGHSGSGPRNAEQEPQILRLIGEQDAAMHQQPQQQPQLLLSGAPPHLLLNALPWPHNAPPPPHLPPYAGLVPPPHDLRPSSPSTHFYAPGPQPEPRFAAYSPPQPHPPPLSDPSLVPPSPFALLPFKDTLQYRSTEPSKRSSFGPLYTSTLSDDGSAYDEEQQLDPALFTDASSPTSNMSVSYTRQSPQHYMNPTPFIDHLVEHYMQTVVNIQYLLADKSSTATMIFKDIHENPLSRQAVKILASIHQHKRQKANAEDRALTRVEHPASQLYDELVQSLFHQGDGYSSALQVAQGFASPQHGYTAEAAMAALLVISSLLFDGGVGSWMAWLRVAFSYVDSLLAQFENPADALSRITDEKISFIIKTTLWFDVIASVTVQEPPHYLQLIDAAFSPSGATIDDGTLPRVVDMLDVMGCDNNTFWAMAQTSALSCWKQDRFQHGALSVMELVSRGSEIVGALTHTALSTSSTEPVDDEESCRLATAAIFRSSTLAWLHSIISGDRPQVPEVTRAVQDTILRLRSIPNHTIREQRLERSIVRSTVFSLFFCGVFTSKRSDREMLLAHLTRQSSDHVGNCTAIKKLLQEIWDQYDRDGKSATVKWRDPLRRSGILLV
ncbi:hypothetical protein ONZ45_g3942 [Pleurotus djamor]|nr:hypothetical protein ONZ45_g3942 [Pleurotus djamor]